MRALLPSAALLLTGCVTADVTVTAYQLQRTIPELRATGHTEIEGRGIDLDDDVEVDEHATTVERAIANCTATTGFGDTPEDPAHPCRIFHAHHVLVDREIVWGRTLAIWGGALFVTIATGVLYGIASSADASDSHMDL